MTPFFAFPPPYLLKCEYHLRASGHVAPGSRMQVLRLEPGDHGATISALRNFFTNFVYVIEKKSFYLYEPLMFTVSSLFLFCLIQQ